MLLNILKSILTLQTERVLWGIFSKVQPWLRCPAL